MAARVGLAPTPNGLTGRRATLDTTWQWLIGAAGRTCTCISSFRRRTPRLFRPRQHMKWSEQQDFHLRPPGPKPGALNTELCSEKHEARLNLILPAVKWWSRRVTLPHEFACRASALLVCHDPQMEIGKPPWCCPRQAEFWRLGCKGWCAAYIMEIGAAAGSCTRTSSVAGRHSAVKSQPQGK